VIYHYRTIFNEETGKDEVVPFDEGQWAAFNGHRPRSSHASCGDVVSSSAGLPDTQIEGGNKMMAEAGIAARFTPDGKMHADGRKEYLKAIELRGFHNNEETRGGNSARHVRPGGSSRRFYTPLRERR